MSEQAPDLRRSIQLVRRHKLIVGVAVALGLLAGAAYTAVTPPMLTSEAVVLLPTSVHDTATQVVIAKSNPVLSAALHSVDPPMSLQTLRSRIQVHSLTFNALAISAQGKTATQAERTANAITDSYIAYVSSGKGPGGRLQARVLEPAAMATGTSLPGRMVETAVPGTLTGALLGVIFALAAGRGERRLRERDAIADSIGVPVLASISVRRPNDAAGWVKLFEEYEVSAIDGWRMRRTLQYLRLAEAHGGTGRSLTVVSLSSDRKALALGPQIAVFAASLGIPTALVFGPQQDINATATLRAACATPPSSRRSVRSRNLRVSVIDADDGEHLPVAALTVVVAVVDGQVPHVRGALRTTATVLGVSAGAATAEQLARVAASAATDNRGLSGILVADPEPTDHTTGRLPVARPVSRRMPTRSTDTVAEARR